MKKSSNKIIKEKAILYKSGSDEEIQQSILNLQQIVDNILKLPDKSKIYIGSGGDLEIFHDGSNTYLENYTGDFIFTQAANDKDMQFKSDDGAGGTTLYYYLDFYYIRTW